MYDPTPSELVGLEPDVRDAAIYLINLYREAGIPAVIVSGRRDRAHNYSVGGAVRSLHLVGRAIDISIAGLATSQALPYLRAGGQLWVSWGGRWGGNFRTPDPVHFDAG